MKTRKRIRKYQYNLHTIAQLREVSIATLRRDMQAGLLDPLDLGSICCYLVSDRKKTRKAAKVES